MNTINTATSGGERRRFSLGLALAGALALSGQSALAGKQVITSGTTKASVVELYTSEGCSSCPPADDYLSKLEAAMGSEVQVMPLAFHVDYWDYLGWKDPFSKAQFTQRQREIGAINKQRTIYTPELVVDGKEARKLNMVKAIEETNAMQAQADIRLELDHSGQQLAANITVDNAPEGQANVLYVAVYENKLVRDIEAGENRGRKLHHNYVVREFHGPSKVHNGKVVNMNLAIDPSWNTQNLGVVVMVKAKNTGETLQAVRAIL